MATESCHQLPLLLSDELPLQCKLPKANWANWKANWVLQACTNQLSKANPYLGALETPEHTHTSELAPGNTRLHTHPPWHFTDYKINWCFTILDLPGFQFLPHRNPQKILQTRDKMRNWREGNPVLHVNSPEEEKLLGTATEVQNHERFLLLP